MASLSPRRQDLLQNLGLEFTVMAAAVDESMHAGEIPALYVQRLAAAKAAAVADHQGGNWVLAADTIVVRDDGVMLGKPRSALEACEMLASLAGRWHTVYTAFTIIHRGRGVSQTSMDQTRVRLMPLSPALIAAYVATGEPMDKAGSYALQGIGGSFIADIHGSPSTVIGLPVHLVVAELMDMGVVEVGCHGA